MVFSERIKMHFAAISGGLLFLGSALLPANLRAAEPEKQEAYTLDRILERVLQNAPEIHQAAAGEKAAAARTTQAKSGYYPSVTANASYMYMDPVSSMTLMQEVPGSNDIPVLPSKLDVFPKNNYNAYLEARMRLYDFGKREAAVDLAKIKETSSKENLQLARQNLAFTAVRIYYSILFLKESEKVQDRQIKDLNESLEQTKQMVEKGTKTNYEVLTSSVRIASAKNRKTDIETAIRKQEIQLHRIMGLPDGTPIEVSGELQYTPQTIDRKDLFQKALEARSEYRIARQDAQAAQAALTMSKRSEAPSIDLAATAGAKNGYMPNINALRGNYSVGVMVQVPIFTGFRNRAEIEEASASVDAAQARMQAVEREVKAEVDQALEELQAGQEKVTSLELQVKQAEEAYERAKAKYEFGVITNLELLDSQTELLQARLSYLQSIYEYTIAGYELKRAMGETFWTTKN